FLLRLVSYFICFFFFSSRRRHTRSKRDWSSDVCSSDLVLHVPQEVRQAALKRREVFLSQLALRRAAVVLEGAHRRHDDDGRGPRSEERRVGKGCRSG